MTAEPTLVSEFAIARVVSRRRARSGHVALLLGCACAAVGTLITKPLAGPLPVLPLVFMQVLASAAATWLLAAATRRTPSPRHIVHLGFPGLLQPGLAYMLAFAGLAITPVSVEGLLWASESLVVVLLAWSLLGEKFRARTLAAVIVGALGVVAVSEAAPPTQVTPLLGVVLILGGVVAAALDTVFSRRLAIEADPTTMTAASQLVGLAAIGASAPLWPLKQLQLLAAPEVLVPVVVSGILIHAIATLLFNVGLSKVSASAASVLFPSVAVFTAAGGIVIEGETLSIVQLAGATLIIGSAIVGSTPPRRAG